MYNLTNTSKQTKAIKTARELHRKTFVKQVALNKYHADTDETSPVQTNCAVKGTAVMPSSVVRAMKNTAPKGGSVYWVDFGNDKEHCLTIGIRPAICLSKDSYNENSPIAWFCPLTTQLKHINCEYHQLVSEEDCIGLRQLSMVLGEQTRPVDRSMVKGYIGEITNRKLLNQLIQVARAIMIEQI